MKQKLIELASLYTVSPSAINCLSSLTTSRHGRFKNFSNLPITFESNRDGRFESNLEASQVPSLQRTTALKFVEMCIVQSLYFYVNLARMTNGWFPLSGAIVQCSDS